MNPLQPADHDGPNTALRGVTMIATALLALALVVWATGEAAVPADRPLFALLAGLLVVGERAPSTWIRFGPAGVVTPIWPFAFALLLVGDPLPAIATAATGALLRAGVPNPLDRLANAAAVALPTAVGALVMTGFGIAGAITQQVRLPWTWAIGIVAGGIAIVAVNAVVGAVELSWRRRLSFGSLVGRGLRARISAEGALMSLAPLWVIALDFSVVLLPVVAITTGLVFMSTRQALERAHEASHDTLTGLANRQAFLDRLGEVTETRATGRAVLIMDLDGFKDINDRLGHQVGDALLIAFADRLHALLPADSTAARLGGDEFGVVMPVGVADDADQVRRLVTDLHAGLTMPLKIEGFPVSVGVSIGVARSECDGATTRDLLRAADVAMYKAKRADRAVELYEAGVRVPQTGRIDLLADLGPALDHHQLQIDYQPILRVADGTVDGVEALVRWNHPEHGTIPPADFIGLAEHTDLIGPLTDLVLRDALVAMRGKGVRLGVNVSARSLHDKHFASHVLSVLGQCGFPVSLLELEVSERAVIANPERSVYTVERLRSAGVRITIDDFGVRHSSYQTLRTMQVDRVKIDREFVRGVLTHPRDRLIVASLVGLAHELGVEVVAEGVESTDVWDAVAALGCDAAQGYGIAVPMPLARFAPWLDQWDAVVEAAPA